MNARVAIRWPAVTFACLAAGAAHAEPHFAVQQGYDCGQCHVSPTGGGMRTTFGNLFAQNLLPARRLEVGDDAWTGALNRWVSIGGNLRAEWTGDDVPNQGRSNEFDVGEARLFLQVEPVPDRVGLYLDERVAPGAATTMEAYARYRTGDGHWYVRAGRFYLPFGLRLADDSAFTRQLGGLNMTTPDDGVELGWSSGASSAQFALTNGSAGGAETDDGKQWTAQFVRAESPYRIGVSAGLNDASGGDRAAVAAFAGLRTGPVAWLGEMVGVRDEGFADGTRELLAALLEANWQVRRGHNLRLAAEWLEPDLDVDEDEQNRWSVVYEYSPVQFLQLRGGVRWYDGIPQNDLQNRTTWFAEIHGFF